MIAHDMHENPFVVWERDPPRAKQFGEAMNFLQLDSGFSVEHFLNGFDFSAIPNGLFVDVGGSHGKVCIDVAQRYPGMRCVVQDMPATIAVGQSQVPEEVKDRVEFMAHDR